MTPGGEVADYGGHHGDLRQRAARPTEENDPAPQPTRPRSGPSQPSAVFRGAELPTAEVACGLRFSRVLHAHSPPLPQAASGPGSPRPADPGPRSCDGHAGTPPPQPSPQAALAARAFVRVAASAPLVRDRLTGGAPVLRHAQRALSAIVTEAETQRAVSLIHALDKPSLPRHMELYHSNCGYAVTLAMAPSDPATTPSNDIFEAGMKRRLLIEQAPVIASERVPGLPQGVHMRAERAGAGALRRRIW